MPPAAGKGRRVKIYDKQGNDKGIKVFKDGKIKPPSANLPKNVIEKAKNLLPAALILLGDLLDPFDAEALGDGELSDDWQDSPCGK